MVPSELQDTKNRLAKTFRMIAHFGWDEVSMGHCSLRLKMNSFLINQVDVDFSLMTAANITQIDQYGVSLDGGTAASFELHRYFHEASHENDVVLHSHYTPLVAMANLSQLPFISQYEAMLGGAALVDEKLFGHFDPAAAQRTVAKMGPAKLVLVARHGAFVFGRTIEEAFFRLYLVCKAAEVIAYSHPPLRQFEALEVAWPTPKSVRHFWESVDRRVQRGEFSEVRKTG